MGLGSRGDQGEDLEVERELAGQIEEKMVLSPPRKTLTKKEILTGILRDIKSLLLSPFQRK
ncbi:hypothetical protein HY501_01525 [Candidatus Woesearchaeota archaeon]|nr:hypothetical protein [Candidatus Woesearchaeota archaeon]